MLRLIAFLNAFKRRRYASLLKHKLLGMYAESVETERRAMNLILVKQVFQSNHQVLYGT